MTTTTAEVTGAGTPEPDSNGATLRSAIGDYFDKLRGGDVGALPAILGFISP
jgi:hypothetical protein